MKEKIFVFGASGHAKVVIDVIEQQGLYDIPFLADDDPGLKGATVYGYQVIGGKTELLASGIKRGIVAIGSNKARCAVSTWLSPAIQAVAVRSIWKRRLLMQVMAHSNVCRLPKSLEKQV